jgi:hypothetical protein
MEFRVSVDAPRRRRGIASSSEGRRRRQALGWCDVTSTCAHCGDLFALRKEPTEERGRPCSSTCLAAARLAHHSHIRTGFDDLRARGADIRARPATSG